MSKLTKRTIESLTPPTNGKDKFVWDSGDGSIKGFGIRFKPSGSASYLIQYRNMEGRTRRLVIGKVNVLTPDQARTVAREKLGGVAKGGDPSAERHAIRAEITVAELCDLFINEAAGQIKPSTLAADKSRIACHIKPLLGKRTVKGLTLADIERFQADIAGGKTAQEKRETGRGGHAKGGQSAAVRTLATLSTIFSFAQRHKLITDNHVAQVKKYKTVKNKRFLTPDEIRALGKVMRENKKVNSKGIAAVKALLLTGCRRNEILSLRSEWIDCANRCIRFEDTKTGAQLRPIGATAVKHLLSQVGNNTAWVFPADRGDGHFIGLRRIFNRLCEEANIKNVRLHSLRHTFAATAAELNFSELTIAGLLGHTVPGVTARYAHMPDRALISAADIVTEHLTALLNGKVAANVLRLKHA